MSTFTGLHVIFRKISISYTYHCLTSVLIRHVKIKHVLDYFGQMVQRKILAPKQTPDSQCGVTGGIEADPLALLNRQNYSEYAKHVSPFAADGGNTRY